MGDVIREEHDRLVAEAEANDPDHPNSRFSLDLTERSRPGVLESKEYRLGLNEGIGTLRVREGWQGDIE